MSALDDARGRLSETRAAKQRAQVGVRDAEVELRRLRRLHSADDDRVKGAEAALARAEAALEGIRRAERAERAAISAGLAEWVRGLPPDELAGLQADCPIALFPVRLETRFFADPAELRVRVYPDAIVADQHDEALTAFEQALGREYWRTAWEPARERDAWRVLLRSTGGPRAAWIVRAMEPANVAARPSGEPVFPDVAPRADTWSRATETRLLPDHWIAMAFRGGAEIHRATSLPIQEPLALTLAPDAAEADLIELADGIRVDRDFLWALDFARSEEIGMALRLPLGPEDLARGFDRLIVLGVKSSLAPEQGSAQLTTLIDSHHYGRGFAFVRQGTPTNNTGIAPAGYPPPSDPDHSFDVERGQELTADGTDGTLLATALGVPAAAMAHVEGAGRAERRVAHAMNEALWPATLGYFTEQLLRPAVSPQTIVEARRHFLDHVSARGPLPAIRAGATPYGILPVTSIERWTAPRRARGLDAHLPDLLRRARRIWLRLAAGAPRVDRSGDPDADLLEVLGMDASSRVVRIRQVLGPAHVQNLARLLGLGDVTRTVAEPSVISELGLQGTGARLLDLVFGSSAHRYRYPLVTDDPPSEDAPLASNYISRIRQASILQLILRSRTRDDDPDRPLLARMMRHGALTLYARVGLDLEVSGGLATQADLVEPELVRIVPGTEQRLTLAERFERPIPTITGTVPLGEFLTGASSPAAAQEYRAALQQLENLPTAELQRLFTETLDVCSFRLDAWITSLASKRLAELREQRALGCYVGAYGWVEDLRRRDASQASGEFVHAPSMPHAAAAAVLRNAHLSRRGEALTQVSLDLSSARVRLALGLFDGVRQGQPLGALLGYRFERTLHERRLDRYIEPLRQLYPLATDPTAPPEGPAERLAARNVVDGLELRNAARAGSIPFGSGDLPASGPDHDSIVGALALLDEQVDAAADLLMAESIYRTVQGQADAAAATLSAVAGGARMPEPEVVRSPRGGIVITHRVAVLLGEVPATAPGWSPAPTPRAAAEPRLDGWIGTLLGDPATVRARLSIPDPTTDEPDRRRERIVTLAELGLRPIDVVALDAAEAARRLGWAIRAEVADAAAVEVRFEADPAWDRATIRTFPEILEVAAAIRATVRAARALDARDLVTAGRSVASAWDVAELQARRAQASGLLDAALTSLRQAMTAVAATPEANLDPLRAALLAAALFGVPGAVAEAGPPSDPVARLTLLDRAAGVERTLAGRLESAAAATTPLDGLTALFDPGFTVLPRLSPPDPVELARSLTLSPTLVGDASAPVKWFQRMARVRSALGRLRRVALTAEPLGAPSAAYEVAQLPHDDSARWAALPFEGDRRPAAGTVSLVVRRELGAPAEGPFAGLFLDEWVELIPSDVQNTGVAVHFDDPGAEPPQAILIAVPPPDLGWSVSLLADVIGETLDLARIRSVDTHALGDMSRLLPAVYLASNIADDTVSTHFADVVAAEATILENP
jgi:hypothetical protein